MKDDLDYDLTYDLAYRCEQENFIRLPYIEWNARGKIVNVSKSLAEKCGFQFETTFLREFKYIDDFLHYPIWKSLEPDLKKVNKIVNFPLFVKSSNLSLMMLDAELEITNNGNYSAVIKIESRDLYKSLVEKAIDGIFISTPDGKFLFVNPKLVEIYGYDSAEEMQRIANITSSIYYEPNIRNELIKQLEKGEVIEDFKFIGKRKDNKLILISKDVYPVCRQNKLLFLYGFVKDISNNTKDIESPIPTFKCDINGHMFYANHALAHWLGYSLQEVLNKNIDEFYFKPFERKTWLKELMKKGELHHSPRYLKNKNGELIKVFVDVTLSTDSIGNPLYIKGWLSNEPGGDVKLSWIDDLKKHLSPKEQDIVLGPIKAIAEEKGIFNELPEEEVWQIAQSVKQVIRENTYSQKRQDTSKLGFITQKEYSLEEKIELDVWHSLNFFSRRREMLKDALNISQVAMLLQLSEGEITQKMKDKMLLGIDCNGEYRFPVWQFDLKHPHGIIDKLPDVLKALEMPDISKLSWLVSPNKTLGKTLKECTPYDVLRTGSSKAKQIVLQEASGVGRC